MNMDWLLNNLPPRSSPPATFPNDPWSHPVWIQLLQWCQDSWTLYAEPYWQPLADHWHNHPLRPLYFQHLHQPLLEPAWAHLLAYWAYWQSSQFALLERVFYLWILVMVHLFVVGLVWDLGTGVWARGWRGCWEEGKRVVFVAMRWVPGVQGVVDREIAKVTADIESKLLSEKRPKQLALPARGWTEDQVRLEWQKYKSLDHVDWKKGRVSGTVYHGGQQFSKLLSDAYAAFSHSNPLHPDVFPSVRQMEADIVQMCLGMYHGGERACGTVTSGGTESILMACKAYRDRGYALKSITEPEMVVPVSIHAAFDKAAGYFGIKIIHIPIHPKTLKVDIAKMKKAINRNTIMIAGSAPGYPHGIIDDIEELGRLAKKYDIGLHVDCCLGSFIVPFLEKAGFPCPPFDFRVPGVSSISCDTHKFGFAPKGSSVIMYSDYKIRHYQYFVAPNWLGGIYASPSIAGSRPGALVAACWTSLVHTGEQGYIESTKAIVNAAQKIRRGIEKIDGIEICGDPLAMVVAFQSEKYNIYAIGDAMTARGWNLNTLQYPSAIHICCTMPTVPVVGDFLKDLQASVDEVKANPTPNKDGMGAIYGMAASIPDKSLVVDIARGYLDVLTRP